VVIDAWIDFVVVIDDDISFEVVVIVDDISLEVVDLSQ
mgnify:CR=1